MIDELLHDRENRYKFILKLIEENNLPVICGKVNYPGYEKNAVTAKRIFNILSEELYISFKDSIVTSKTMTGMDGKSLILVVDMDEIEAKKATVSIEEGSKLGRLFDIDIYSLEKGVVTRKELGLAQRRCIICDGDPWICRKLNKHLLSDLLSEIDKILNTYEIQK